MRCTFFTLRFCLHATELISCSGVFSFLNHEVPHLRKSTKIFRNVFMAFLKLRQCSVDPESRNFVVAADTFCKSSISRIGKTLLKYVPGGFLLKTFSLVYAPPSLENRLDIGLPKSCIFLQKFQSRNSRSSSGATSGRRKEAANRKQLKLNPKVAGLPHSVRSYIWKTTKNVRVRDLQVINRKNRIENGRCSWHEPNYFGWGCWNYWNNDLKSPSALEWRAIHFISRCIRNLRSTVGGPPA